MAQQEKGSDHEFGNQDPGFDRTRPVKDTKQPEAVKDTKQPQPTNQSMRKTDPSFPSTEEEEE